MASASLSLAPAAAPAAAASSTAASLLLGDTHDWERIAAAAPDVDLEDDAEAASAADAASSALRSQGQFATFVKEAAEIESLLQQLPYTATAAQRLCDILDLYQEQCELLDPHLPHAVTALMNFVHAVIRPGKANPVPPINSTTGAILLGAAAQASVFTPTSAACSQGVLLARVFQVLYTLSKVRGYKTIVHFFPHEVADLEPTLALLQRQMSVQSEEHTWEVKYGLLLWLSIIVLIPFDLSTVDSSMAASADAPAGSTRGIIASLIALGEEFLSNTGPPRDAAAVMLAKLFSRADMHASHLAAFFRWSTEQITRVAREHAQKQASATNIFLMTGVFRAMCQIFRHAPRDVLLRHVGLVYGPILQQHETFAQSSNTLLRKLFVKLSQRVGLTYLPVRVAKWRYQRGHRSLLGNLQQQAESKAAAAAAATTLNPLLGSTHATAPPRAAASAAAEVDDRADAPLEIESIIQILLDGLRDRDTIVRWSAAKGIGRITNCLSESNAEEVVEAVLDLFQGRETDGAWHGGCLALAELARRGLLLPHQLVSVVPLTLKALVYDKRTSTHSVGAHVRDASCYVMWAFARAYAPDVMAPYMQSLAEGLLTVCVFDREVNVRRASSAAFQEHVGRQGSAAFSHGMEILQLADYFTVSNRAHAYTVVAFQVAQYEAYTQFLIDHLLDQKAKHWEKEMRELTAKTLGILTRRNSKAQTYMREVVVRELLKRAVQSPDLSEKHGAVLAVAEVLLSLHAMDPKEYVSVELRLQTCDVVNTLTSAANAQMLNGRGGQIMREAICHLVEVIAQIGLLFTSPKTMAYIRPYQAVLDENLAHSNDGVQLAAIQAAEQFVRGYYLPLATDDAKTVAEKLARAKPVMDHYVRTLSHPSSLAGVTRGFAAALGTFPRALLITSSVKAADAYSAVSTAAASASSSSSAAAPPPPAGALVYQPLSRIMQTLIMSCTECGQPDAETRRNSVQALVRLVDELTEEDLLQYLTPMPAPPVPASVTIAAPAAAAPALSAAREKELKAVQKQQKIQHESLAKYWHRDLVELGLPGNRIFERVATALLISLDDYATDNRGDVGSWVREAAMVGLEAMLIKLARMQAARPNENIFPAMLAHKTLPALLKQAVEKIDRVREKSGQIFHRLLWHSQPDIPFILLRDELRARFPAANVDRPIDWSSPSQTFPLLTPLLSLASGDAVRASRLERDRLLQSQQRAQEQKQQQQEADAQDRARRAAAQDQEAMETNVTLQRSLNHITGAGAPQSSLANVASAASMLQAPVSLPASAPGPSQPQSSSAPAPQPQPSLVPPVSAAQPSSAAVVPGFPYHRAVLSGLLISVGGLTESVVKSSSESLLEYVSALASSVSSKDADAAHSLALLKLLASDLLYILQLERGHARVIVPAFKTLELLLSQNLLEELTLEVSTFGPDLLSRVWKEVSKSTNIHKLMACISVLVGLLSYEPLRATTFQHLLTLLGHATYPKVRRITGESLYNALLISEEFIPGAEEDPERAQPVLDILSVTAWDGPVSEASQERDKLYPLLQIAKPIAKAKAPQSSARAAAAAARGLAQGDISALGTDYASLVRNIGH